MHVLVTGCSGFVGTALVTHLAERGFSGCAVSRAGQTPVPRGWTALSRQAALEGAWLQEKDAGRPDCVIHLEVKQHVDSPTPADVEDFEQVNVGGTRRWLEWCANAGVDRFMLFSTIKAAGDSLLPQDEETTTLPTTI